MENSALDSLGKTLTKKIFKMPGDPSDGLSLYVGGPLFLVDAAFNVASYGFPFVNFFKTYYSGVYPVPLEELNKYQEISYEEALQINPNIVSLVEEWNKNPLRSQKIAFNTE